MDAPVSAAERRVSPANIPRPPEYVGRSLDRAISIEKYPISREERSMGRLGFCGTGGWKGWERLILRENPCLGKADVLGLVDFWNDSSNNRYRLAGNDSQIIDTG